MKEDPATGMTREQYEAIVTLAGGNPRWVRWSRVPHGKGWVATFGACAASSWSVPRDRDFPLEVAWTPDTGYLLTAALPWGFSICELRDTVSEVVTHIPILATEGSRRFRQTRR